MGAQRPWAARRPGEGWGSFGLLVLKLTSTFLEPVSLKGIREDLDSPGQLRRSHTPSPGSSCLSVLFLPPPPPLAGLGTTSPPIQNSLRSPRTGNALRVNASILKPEGSLLPLGEKRTRIPSQKMKEGAAALGLFPPPPLRSGPHSSSPTPHPATR